MSNRIPKIQKRVQFARKCIFCETNNANSREHFYSEWMHKLLPLGTHGTYSGERIDEHPKTKTVSRHDKQIKPGELFTKKMKVVCQLGNNGWMSVLEEAAKPLLTPLITGDHITLERDHLDILARWITLKTIVSEHDRRDTEVTPQVDRSAFSAVGKIPDYFNIYILTHKCESRIGYVRTSQTVSRTRDGPQPPLEGRQKNCQQLSIILGNSMIHVNAARVDGFRIEDNVTMPRVIARQIWPPNTAPLTWPAEPILTCDQMRSLAYTMEDIMADPKAKYGGDLASLPPV